MNPEDLLEKTKEELVSNLEEFNRIYDEVMENLVMIRAELLNRLIEEKKDGELVGDYQIKKAKRVTFKTTLEQAEELGAVKKAPDTDILKKLHSKGIEVPGVTVTEYLTVRKIAQDGETI